VPRIVRCFVALGIVGSLARVSPAEAGTDEGKAIYVAKCQACHGSTGKGDGPASRALPKKPKDFTTAEYWKSATDESVKAVILQGMPGTIMRGFPMAPEQLTDLVAYLRSLAPPAPAP
jgi:mono/diheme cytochrome c family protein